MVAQSLARHAKANWIFATSIPNSWTPRHEVAVILQIHKLEVAVLVARAVIEIGKYVWPDCIYILDARTGGSAMPGKYMELLGVAKVTLSGALAVGSQCTNTAR